MTDVADDTNPNPPIRRLSDNELVRTVHEGFHVEPVADEGAKARNTKLALEELGQIERLRQHPAFQWFSDTCVDRSFKESRQLLAAVNLELLPPRSVARIIAEFQTWRKIARWLDERELEHRRYLNPQDPHLDVIRKRLDLLS